MKKRFIALLSVSMFLTVAASFTLAAESPDRESLLCAVTEVIECNAKGACLEVGNDEVGLPDFILIDLTAKKLIAADSESKRESSFNSHLSAEGLTVLTGADGARGWSAVLSANNTRLSASISDELAGFVVFGVCRGKP